MKLGLDLVAALAVALLASVGGLGWVAVKIVRGEPVPRCAAQRLEDELRALGGAIAGPGATMALYDRTTQVSPWQPYRPGAVLRAPSDYLGWVTQVNVREGGALITAPLEGGPRYIDGSTPEFEAPVWKRL